MRGRRVYECVCVREREGGRESVYVCGKVEESGVEVCMRVNVCVDRREREEVRAKVEMRCIVG